MQRARLLLALLLAGCGADAVQDDRPLVVSAIGRPPRIAPDPDRRALDGPSAALLAATAQGLVRFDGGGQVEAGLAIRWDVSDDGLFYTFRLRDGLAIDAGQAARRLRRAIARSSRNALKPILGAIGEIVAVTPEVIELRLTAPRPNLLQLLAQPELAVRVRGAGGGPLRVAARDGDAIRLVPLPDPDAPDPGAAPERPSAGDEVRLRGERAALAVARFRAGAAAVVTGGSFADLPIALAAQADERELRFDPAAGLFGFEVAAAAPFLRAPENRRALAMAIDRDRIVAAFAPQAWRAATALLPPGTESAAPAMPDWQPLPLAVRADRAARAVAAWRDGGPPPVLRVAMPAGPGARLLFTLVSIDWRAIGVAPVAVPSDAPADLRLIDLVAPGDIATWYLRRFACARALVCSVVADRVLERARTTPSITERRRLIGEADARLAAAVPFIPIATPLRWSLVSRELDGWRDNPRAVHPLYHLRTAE